MTNLALLIGTGYFGEDVFHKLPWLKNLSNSEVYIASRIDPKVHFNSYLETILGKKDFDELKKNIHELEKISKGAEIVYRSSFLKKNYSKKEISLLETWLGISFKYIASFDRRFFDYKKLVDSRDKNLYNFIAGLVTFFKNFFKKNKIAYFVNTIEDDCFSTVAYYVAKRLGIKILGFMRSRFPKEGIILCEDFKGIYEWSNDKTSWNKIKKLYGNYKFLGESNIEKNRLKSLRQKTESIIKLMQFNRWRGYVVKKYPYEKFIIPNENLLNSSKLFIKKLLRKKFVYISARKEISKKDKYFLFPLHYTEDAQLTFREPLTDQFSLIKSISRALPVDYYLYVKPHPHYLGSDVSIRRIRNISKIPNIKIIDPMMPIIPLIENSSGVITINSSTGFEALVFGVPVLSFGHEFYSKQDICHVVNDLNLLSETIIEMIKMNKDRNYVKDFIKKVYCNTIWIDGASHDVASFYLSEKDGLMVSNVFNLILDG